MESEFAVLCLWYHVYKNLWDASVGEDRTAVGVVRSSSDVKERHRRRPRTQEDISCLLAISGRSAACCYFWQISDRGTIVL